jgi:6-phosphogluconolactonase
MIDGRHAAPLAGFVQKGRMPVHVYASMSHLADAFHDATLDAAVAAVAARGQFTVALTGGSAAHGLYPRLGKASLMMPWAKTHVFFGDERCVPFDHSDSNAKLAHGTFLDDVAVPHAHIHQHTDADAAQDDLLRVCGGVLDVVHVGVGPDGHICSLFPGHALLDENDRVVAAINDSPKPPPSRITLTPKALRDARSLWFIAAGAGKADIVKRILVDKDMSLPAARFGLLPHARWFCDADAARGSFS